MTTQKKEAMKVIAKWALARLAEPSTWKGVAVVAGAAGIAVAPELIMQVGAVVGAAVGLVDILRKEKD